MKPAKWRPFYFLRDFVNRNETLKEDLKFSIECHDAAEGTIEVLEDALKQAEGTIKEVDHSRGIIIGEKEKLREELEAYKRKVKEADRRLKEIAALATGITVPFRSPCSRGTGENKKSPYEPRELPESSKLVCSKN